MTSNSCGARLSSLGTTTRFTFALMDNLRVLRRARLARQNLRRRAQCQQRFNHCRRFLQVGRFREITLRAKFFSQRPILFQLGIRQDHDWRDIWLLPRPCQKLHPTHSGQSQIQHNQVWPWKLLLIRVIAHSSQIPDRVSRKRHGYDFPGKIPLSHRHTQKFHILEIIFNRQNHTRLTFVFRFQFLFYVSVP